MAGLIDLSQLATDRVNIACIYLNDWNPNEQDEFMYEKMRISLLEVGWRDPIKVRNGDAPGRYEIVDGEHRWRAAQDILAGDLPEGGWEEEAEAYVEMYGETVPVISYGDVTREEAQELTLMLNNLKGEPDTLKLADLVTDLRDRVGLDRVLRTLPYRPGVLESLFQLKNWDPSGYERGGEVCVPPDEWIELVFKLPEDAAAVVENEIARVGAVLDLEKGLSENSRRGLILERICALSARMPPEGLAD